MGPFTEKVLAEQRAATRVRPTAPQEVTADGLDHANRTLRHFEQLTALSAFMRDELGTDELYDHFGSVARALKNPGGPTARALLEALRRMGHTS
jgi:hypothetical protein